MGMRLDKYVEDVLTIEPQGIRALRVEDISHGKDDLYYVYNIILVPKHVDADGAIYTVIADIDEIAEKVDLYPELFVVFDAWTVDDLIKGAMYVEDLYTNYFESEV